MKTMSQKERALACAIRVARLIELDAPTQILETELRVLTERCGELPRREMDGEKPKG